MASTGGKSLRWSLLTLLSLAAVLFALEKVEGLVPAAWPRVSRSHGVQPFSCAGTTPLRDVYQVAGMLEYRQRGVFIVTGVELTVTSVQGTVNGVPDADIESYLSGSSNVPSVVAQISQGLPLSSPDASALVSKGLAAPGKAATIDFPERKTADLLMSVRAVLQSLAWPLLFGALVWFLAAVYQVIDARRAVRSHTCRSCGYELGGLPASAPCPECGKPTEPGQGFAGEGYLKTLRTKK